MVEAESFKSQGHKGGVPLGMSAGEREFLDKRGDDLREDFGPSGSIGVVNGGVEGSTGEELVKSEKDALGAAEGVDLVVDQRCFEIIEPLGIGSRFT